MKQLSKKTAAFGMNHFGQTPVTRNTTIIVADNDMLVVGCRFMDRGNLYNDETRPAAGARLVVASNFSPTIPCSARLV